MQEPQTNVRQLSIPIWIALPLLALTLVVGLGGGFLASSLFSNYTASKEGGCTESAEVCAYFSNFWQTWQLVEDNYVDPEAIKPRDMVNGAINGMLDTLGDKGHTYYMSPEEARMEQEALNASFEGIGAYIDVREGQPMIVQPMPKSPAEAAGILPGDLIMKVDGEDVFGITTTELQSRVRGPKNTSVTLTVQHVGATETVDITIKRAQINVPSTTWSMLEGDIAHVHLNQFSMRASEDMRDALNEAKAAGAKGIIFDVRNNPGGLVQQLVNVASLFLPKDTVILIEESRDGSRSQYKANGDVFDTEIPVVVLVNENSASSAEIVAIALKENGRAKVVGMPTFGTATVLRGYNLNEGAQVRIGTTQWLTPSGEVVRGKGIQPDELVDLPEMAYPLSPTTTGELTPEELLESNDTQLLRALEILTQE
jgi:carboxyl-terminal processing protease